LSDELLPINGWQDPQRAGDVVFVHGLNGNPREYWCHEGKHENFWPAWLGQDLPSVGVWSMGYENAAFKSSRHSIFGRFGFGGFAMPLSDRAKSILLQLEVSEIGQRPLVFVTHSMGGLVVKQLLRTAYEAPLRSPWKPILKNTRGVCFIATPHIGSDLATWASYFGTLLRTNISTEELNPRESRLRELNEFYRNYVTRKGVNIKTLSFFETKPLGGSNILVVTERDADPGVANAGLYAVGEDHLSICKPPSPMTPIYMKVLRFIKDECFRLAGPPLPPGNIQTQPLVSGPTPDALSSLDEVSRALNIPNSWVHRWRDEGCPALKGPPYDVAVIRRWLSEKSEFSPAIPSSEATSTILSRDITYWMAAIALGLSVSQEVRSWLLSQAAGESPTDSNRSRPTQKNTIIFEIYSRGSRNELYVNYEISGFSQKSPNVTFRNNRGPIPGQIPSDILVFEFERQYRERFLAETGRFDHESVHFCLQVVRDYIRTCPVRFVGIGVGDVSGPQFMSSWSVAKLAAISNAVWKRNGKLVVFSIAPLILDAFKATHFDKLCTIAHDKDAGIRMLKQLASER
jgi:hypothetical protein